MDKAAKRLKLLRNRMEAKKVDLVVLGPGPHMQWLLGFHPHADERPCLPCISQRSAAFFDAGAERRR